MPIIKLKNSSSVSNGAAKAPSTLEVGEVAINNATNYESLFLKNSSNSIIKLPINFLKGVTSDVQAQLNGKAKSNHNQSYYTITRPTGINSAGTIHTLDVPLIDYARANRTFGLRPDGVTVEYSTDNGATWIDYGCNDNQKKHLVNETRGYRVRAGKGITPKSVKNRLRITLAPTDGRYCNAEKAYIWFNSDGATGCTVDIEYSTIGEKTNFKPMLTNQPISGWSGANLYNLSGGTFGGSSSQTSNYYAYRFTIKIGGVSETYNSIPEISDIRIYGSNVWSAVNTMMNRDHMYGWDEQLNVVFDNLVSSRGFLKKDSNDSYVLLGGGGHKLISDFWHSGNSNKSDVDWTCRNLSVHGDYVKVLNTNSALKGSYMEMGIYRGNHPAYPESGLPMLRTDSTSMCLRYASGIAGFYADSNENTFELRSPKGSYSGVVISSYVNSYTNVDNGNFGIGTRTPTSKLYVNGDAYISTALKVKNIISTESDNLVLRNGKRLFITGGDTIGTSSCQMYVQAFTSRASNDEFNDIAVKVSMRNKDTGSSTGGGTIQWDMDNFYIWFGNRKIKTTGSVEADGDVIAYSSSAYNRPSTLEYLPEEDMDISNSPTALDVLIEKNNKLEKQVEFLIEEITKLKQLIK